MRALYHHNEALYHHMKALKGVYIKFNVWLFIERHIYREALDNQTLGKDQKDLYGKARNEEGSL